MQLPREKEQKNKQ